MSPKGWDEGMRHHHTAQTLFRNVYSLSIFLDKNTHVAQIASVMEEAVKPTKLPQVERKAIQESNCQGSEQGWRVESRKTRGFR